MNGCEWIDKHGSNYHRIVEMRESSKRRYADILFERVFAKVIVKRKR